MRNRRWLGIVMSALMMAGSASSLYAGTGTMRNLTPAQIANEMNVGWNLGNSLDAYGTHSLNDETCWGNPRTTKRMIDTVKAKGFNTIRIPVSWGDHMSGAPNFTVDQAWMNRVQEVVDYAIDDNMYVLLDTHHETSWLKPDNAHVAASEKQLAALWTQIAERFKNYDEHLLFEGMNEPRIVGSSKEWNGGDAEGRSAVNRLNKAFINAVRKTGGNNSKRCLVVCPYGNNADTDGLIGFEIPSDPNIMVAVHAYTPYGFTYVPEGNPSWATAYWDGSLKNTVDDVMNKINQNLVSKGATVLITEFGAVNKNNDSEVVKWTKDFMGTASKYGVKCVWWDNNQHQSGSERFGILDRNSCTWTRNSVVDTIIQCGGKGVTPTPTPSDTIIKNYATLNDGWYYIKNTNAQKYLEVKDNVGGNGQNVQIGTGTGKESQKWYLKNVGNGYVTLKNGTGYMLDVNYGKNENNTNIQVYSANGASAQEFKLAKTNQNNVYGIVTRCSADTKSLDVASRSTAEGANVIQYAYQGASNQIWVLEACNGSSVTPVPTPEPTPNPQPSTSEAVKVKVTSDWGSGAVADITITNTTGKDLNNWTCTFTSSRPITSIWNATLVSQSGNTYTVKAPDWQANLAKNASFTFGCQMGQGDSNVTVSNVTLK